MYLALFSAPPPPKQKEEQAEDSFPMSRIFSRWKIPRPRLAPSCSDLAKLQVFASHPSLSLVNPEFKKRESAEVLRNPYPQNIVSAKLSLFSKRLSSQYLSRSALHSAGKKFEQMI